MNLLRTKALQDVFIRASIAAMKHYYQKQLGQERGLFGLQHILNHSLLGMPRQEL